MEIAEHVCRIRTLDKTESAILSSLSSEPIVREQIEQCFMLFSAEVKIFLELEGNEFTELKCSLQRFYSPSRFCQSQTHACFLESARW